MVLEGEVRKENTFYFAGLVVDQVVAQKTSLDRYGGIDIDQKQINDYWLGKLVVEVCYV